MLTFAGLRISLVYLSLSPDGSTIVCELTFGKNEQILGCNCEYAMTAEYAKAGDHYHQHNRQAGPQARFDSVGLIHAGAFKLQERSHAASTLPQRHAYQEKQFFTSSLRETRAIPTREGRKSVKNAGLCKS